MSGSNARSSLSASLSLYGRGGAATRSAASRALVAALRARAGGAGDEEAEEEVEASIAPHPDTDIPALPALPSSRVGVTAWLRDASAWPVHRAAPTHFSAVHAKAASSARGIAAAALYDATLASAVTEAVRGMQAVCRMWCWVVDAAAAASTASLPCCFACTRSEVAQHAEALQQIIDMVVRWKEVVTGGATAGLASWRVAAASTLTRMHHALQLEAALCAVHPSCAQPARAVHLLTALLRDAPTCTPAWLLRGRCFAAMAVSGGFQLAMLHVDKVLTMHAARPLHVSDELARRSVVAAEGGGAQDLPPVVLPLALEYPELAALGEAAPALDAARMQAEAAAAAAHALSPAALQADLQVCGVDACLCETDTAHAFAAGSPQRERLVLHASKFKAAAMRALVCTSVLTWNAALTLVLQRVRSSGECAPLEEARLLSGEGFHDSALLLALAATAAAAAEGDASFESRCALLTQPTPGDAATDEVFLEAADIMCQQLPHVARGKAAAVLLEAVGERATVLTAADRHTNEDACARAHLLLCDVRMLQCSACVQRGEYAPAAALAAQASAACSAARAAMERAALPEAVLRERQQAVDAHAREVKTLVSRVQFLNKLLPPARRVHTAR